MATESPRPEKVAVVNEVRERLTASSAALLTEYRGLNVDEMARLRQAVRDAGGQYKVYKNTLVRLAVRELGLDELEAMLEGPTALAFVDGDAVLVAKSLRDFAKASPALVVKGGVLGTTVMSAKDALALADLASRETLLAQLAGGLAAPLQKMAGLLQALPRNMAYGLSALIEKKAAEAPAAAAGEPAAAADAEEPAAAAEATEPVAEAPELVAEAPEPAAEAPEPVAEAPEPATAPGSPEESETTEKEQ